MGKPQRKRKRRTHAPDENIVGSLDPSKKKVPRALVLRTGKHTKVVKKLEKDLKLCMRPHTADKLKQKKGNVMKDFLNVVGPLGISHFLILSATEKCQYLKVAKTPQGPTATFRIEQWSSCADFAAAMKHYTSPVGSFKYPPLLVLSGFKNSDRHGKLCASLFQVSWNGSNQPFLFSRHVRSEPGVPWTFWLTPACFTLSKPFPSPPCPCGRWTTHRND